MSGTRLRWLPSLAAGLLVSSPAALVAAETESKSLLAAYYDSLGPIYGLLLLACSITLVAYAMINLLAVRRTAIAPAELASDFQARLDARELPEAFELVDQSDSLLGKVLASGMSKVAAGGYAQAIAAVREAVSQQRFRLLARLNYMLLVALLALLLGVLASIDDLSAGCSQVMQTSEAAAPARLAQSLATALMPLRISLYMSIPAVVLYGVLRTRLPGNIELAHALAEQLLSRFENRGSPPPR